MKLALTSDNIAGACEAVVAEMIKAAQGEAMPYGGDPLTEQVTKMFAELFECDVAVFLVSTGTAANVLSLAALTPPWGSVLCHPESHIINDECSAPEFYTNGARLVGVAGEEAKISVSALEQAINKRMGDVHSVQPSAVSLSQVTEIGSVYSLAELEEISQLAHSKGLKVHMDGARFANALVSLGCTPAQMTWQSGIDIVSFGATKNGAMAAEAIVVFDKNLAQKLALLRKRGGHLHSKMRLLSAQMLGYLSDDVWLNNARHANAMMALLQKGMASIAGVEIIAPAQANMLFCRLPVGMAEALLAQGFSFYTGRWAEGVVRFVTSFQTQQADVEDFIACARDLSTSSTKTS